VGDWLNAIPSPALGLSFHDKSLGFALHVANPRLLYLTKTDRRDVEAMAMATEFFDMTLSGMPPLQLPSLQP